jgi:hypothetical protein
LLCGAVGDLDVDILFTISLCPQLSAIEGHGFGLSEPFARPSDSPWLALVCVGSATQMLHAAAFESLTGSGLDRLEKAADG